MKRSEGKISQTWMWAKLNENSVPALLFLLWAENGLGKNNESFV
jgi:hypothetical protein